jgi:hypothetical protein
MPTKIDTQNTERTTDMTALTNEIIYHVHELDRVATDLRNERNLAATTISVGRRARLAVGNALVQIGIALTASNRQVSAQAR